MIEFTKGEKHKYIQNEKEFWLALIDTQERSETSLMVKKVALKLEEDTRITNDALNQLGNLANDCVYELKSGNLNALAKNLNRAQHYLNVLGVSTHKINNIIEILKKEGALAAKLTGAGGGGLVMGIFETQPKQLYSLFNEECLFITRVPKYGKRI
jgi:mevalonate kinase